MNGAKSARVPGLRHTCFVNNPANVRSCVASGSAHPRLQKCKGGRTLDMLQGPGRFGHGRINVANASNTTARETQTIQQPDQRAIERAQAHLDAFLTEVKCNTIIMAPPSSPLNIAEPFAKKDSTSQPDSSAKECDCMVMIFPGEAHVGRQTCIWQGKKCILRLCEKTCLSFACLLMYNWFKAGI